MELRGVIAKDILLGGTQSHRSGIVKTFLVILLNFLRPLLGQTRFDCQRNSDIRNGLKVNNSVERH